MRYVITNVETSEGSHCLYSAMSFALQKSNFKLSETDIYFLGNGLSLWYNKGSNFKWVIPDIEVLESLQANCEMPICFSFNVDDDFYRRAYQAIREDKIVFLYTYSQYLDYSDIYSGSAGHEHIINLYGYDEEEDKAYVSDSYLLDYSGKVLTYNGLATLSNIRKGTWGCAWFDQIPENQISRDKIFQIAIGYIRKFLTEEKNERGDYYTGRAAFKEFFEEFDELMTYDDSSFKDITQKIYYDLRIANIMHIIHYLKSFVFENSAYFGGKSDMLISSMEKLYLEWKKLLANIYKSGFSLNRKSFPGIKRKAFELIDSLSAILEEMI